MKINNQTKQIIKLHMRDYLMELDYSATDFFTCVNPNHEDKHPSMKFNPKNNTIHCFSCGYTLDIFALYALKNNLDIKNDFIQITKALADKYNIELKEDTYSTPLKADAEPKQTAKENYSKYYDECHKKIIQTDYLQSRCITESLINKYNIGYDSEKKQIIFPISKSYYIGRTVTDSENKHFKPKGTCDELFNIGYLKNNSNVVWVTESVIDALSLESINGNIKAIALNGVNNIRKLHNEIVKTDFKGALVLALDTDQTGINKSQELSEMLEDTDVIYRVYNSDAEKYNGYKDINEWLCNDAEQLKKSIEYYNTNMCNILASQIKKENVLNYLSSFNAKVMNTNKPKPISTGFETLDNILDGGFMRSNLIILGAISSLGKTTLALQIGDNIARSGEDVLIFSLEMSRDELIAKSLSREMYKEAIKDKNATHALDTKSILNGKIFDETQPYHHFKVDLYNRAYSNYSKNIAENLYITECNGKDDITVEYIENKIKKHIELTGRKPFIIVDYLQIIRVSNNKNNTDKQLIDIIITSLKRIARDNDVAILAISAFNRSSYKAESGLSSFRDSSSIEYSADTLISLQHSVLDGKTDDETKKVDINAEQKKVERIITLKILKQRLGRVADIKGIKFNAKFNYFNFDTINTD